MTGPGEQNAGLPRHRRVWPLTADDVVGAGLWLLDQGSTARKYRNLPGLRLAGVHAAGR
jgi:hypothetical protein